MRKKLLNYTDEEIETISSIFKRKLLTDGKQPSINAVFKEYGNGKVQTRRLQNWLETVGGADKAIEILSKKDDEIKALYKEVVVCIRNRLQKNEIEDKTLIELFKLSLGLADGGGSRTQVNVVNGSIDDYLEKVNREDAEVEAELVEETQSEK